MFKIWSYKPYICVACICDCALLPTTYSGISKVQEGEREHSIRIVFETADEIMVLFILRRLILQTHMPSHPVGPDVWFLVGLFVYFHTSCVWTAKALAKLRKWAGSPEPSLVAYVISTIISWAGSFDNVRVCSLMSHIMINYFPYPAASYSYVCDWISWIRYF